MHDIARRRKTDARRGGRGGGGARLTSAQDNAITRCNLNLNINASFYSSLLLDFLLLRGLALTAFCRVNSG